MIKPPRDLRIALRATLVVAMAGALPQSAPAQTLTEVLAAQATRGRATIQSLASSPLVDGERPRLKSLFDDAGGLLKAGRLFAAVETLASAVPGTIAVSRAASGWDDSGQGPGKHIDALAKEWEDVGRTLKAGRAAFPSVRPSGQNAFVRGMAEQSYGQVDEHYAVAVDYGRMSGVSSGAYYLGRAEGHMAWALALAGAQTGDSRPVSDLATLAGPLNRLEDEIVTAYAKPGSTAQHSNFILANSSLKLAKELEAKGRRHGALITLLRGLFSLSLATLDTPGAAETKSLAEEAARFEARFGAAKVDETIGSAFLEKARIALEKSEAGGEGSDRERLRAAGLLRVVIPRYIEIMETQRR